MATFPKAIVPAAALGVALWAPCALAGDPPGAKPGDDQLTCEQIAAELQPYVQAMKPNAMALGQSEMELKQKAEKHMAEETPKMLALSAEATAAGRDPTGLAQRAVNKQIEAEQKAANERAKADMQSVADRASGQMQTLTAQANQMQNDPRLGRLMELGRKKGCDKGDKRR